MRKEKGFTMIELLITLVIGTIIMLPISGLVVDFFLNNRGATEERAYEGMNAFIMDNDLQVSRSSCAGDSDGDGYGSCTIVLESGERIYLDCPSSWGSVNLFGASGCKEIEARFKGGVGGIIVQ